MNFKLTKQKVIASIAIPIIVWIFVFIISISNSIYLTFIKSILDMHDVGNIFSVGNISLFVVEIIIVYVILSLFSKKS